MPSIQPTPSNNYYIDNSTELGPETLNEIFGSISQRLTALQETAAGFEDAVSEAAIALAEGRLQYSVTPSLNALNARVTEITGLLSDAEDRIAALQAGGVLAVNVPVAPGGRFAVGSTAQSALAQLDADLDSLEADMAALSTSVAQQIAAIQMLPAEAVLLSANTNLVVGKAYRIITAGITLTLPANPAAGASIRLIDGGVLSRTSTVTVARNGKTIMGLNEDLTLNVSGCTFTIWYNGTTWKLQ
ncbi:hypothetical protein [Rhizobium rhizoryzae]|uniref:Uncharacterized protein n=1 Tax=Rhizobium rhizoryzae TaxID=451876 RepID=A0A7W6LK31_9HYPH|nr:hypothetical protein [Rhizobium rhizoryzae]MBB4145820.1 hypothetical protein [Rhizobium rhizoryzae]